MTYAQRVGLIILDGWGIGPDPTVDAIAQAQTPFFDHLMATYPHATLTTHGLAVGLPEGQMGNSEVGHMNLGAGRVVYQELARINVAISDGSLASNPVLLDAMDKARTENKPIHLLGLISDGGVHSHIDHLKALCSIIESSGVQQAYIHGFTDGRDTGPETGAGFIRTLEHHLSSTPHVQLASLVGRYYAMDRDKRWERIKKAYDLLVHATGTPVRNGAEAMEASYAQGITDEFLEPVWIRNDAGAPPATIQSGDIVLFFNFRTDRPRQLTAALTQQAFPEQNMQPLDLHFVTMTLYDASFRHVAVLFEKDNLNLTMGEVLALHGKSQLRIAETEKYPHVSYFFSGGRELPFPHEERRMIASPKVATYDLQPEMSAVEVTDQVLDFIHHSAPDFICLNYANTDMVGHTGVFKAAQRAAETVDACLERLVPQALEAGYHLIILADHGNADCMINPDGTPNTAHTMNPVPVIYVSPDNVPCSIKKGKLADIAPTLLYLLGISPPAVMDGEVLLEIPLK